MKLSMYLHEDCLTYNGTDTMEEVKNKLSQFADDLSSIYSSPIVDRSENQLILSDTFYEANVYQNFGLFDFLYAEGGDYDAALLIVGALGNDASTASFTPAEIKAKAVYNPKEQDCVSTLIVLNESVFPDELMQFDKYELVYNQHSWLHLRRQILANHPHSAHEFIASCRLYFSDMAFSESAEDSVVDYLTSIPRQIVYHLSYMNDYLYDFYCNHLPDVHMNSLLAEFAGRYHFDKAGSLNATPEKKGNYTFTFHDDQGIGLSICCEPHFKIQFYDSIYHGSDANEKCRSRIYFFINHEKYKGIGKHILVGSIGPHA